MREATMVIVSLLAIVVAVQLLWMLLFEPLVTVERKARVVIYALVLFTLCWRFYLYVIGEALVTPAGLGIGTTATLAMICLEYIRVRETRR